MKKVSISTLGCKVNQYESASFRSGFEELGHHVVSSDEDSDIVVINTCAVTGKAGAQSRQEIRKSLRNHPDAKIIITGCLSQMADGELEKIEELQGRSVSVVSNGDKHLLVDLALQESSEISFQIKSITELKEISHLPVRNFGSRTRAYLRIQDGCNSFCTYCIVPYTRGRSRSLSVSNVLNQAKVFEEQGYKEIVITGIHVGNYGADLHMDIDLSGIIHKLCCATPGIRYRLSSIEPLEITDKLLESMAANDNFMPHLHIPLQSGNDEILLRMNRRYSTSQFREKLDICRNTIKDVAFGIDILAGFPGESDEQFSTTCSFLQDMDFTYLHVFPYSKRPGTPAATFKDQIKKGVKDKRVSILRDIGKAKKRSYYSRFSGDIRPVLVEGKRDKDGNLKGFTDNYIPTFFSGDDSLKNSVVQVRLKNHISTGIRGEVIYERYER